MIAEKKGEAYHHVLGFMRTKLRFSILKSTLMAIRGVRGKRHSEPNIGAVAFNMIPNQASYDT